MQSADDTQLLTEFTTRRSEEAFATLVHRHINLVYSSALRQVQNPQLAQEVTQVVFIILAQKAHTLRTETILSGWLYRTARFAAANALKKESRRQRREQEAHMQSMLHETDSESIWENISPLLDEAMSHLGEKDRGAVILRYFEEKSLSEVGVALGTNEDTARKRVSRSVEKLRKFFTKRGTVLPAATLIGLLSANTVSAAPAGLASTIAAGAILKGTIAGASTLTLIKGTLKIMAWTKLKTAAVVSAAVILGGGTTAVVVNQLRTIPAIEERAQEGFQDWQVRGFDSRILETTPPQVMILPARFPGSASSGSVNSKIMGVGQTVRDILSMAYDVKSVRIVTSEVFPNQKYDFISNLSNGQKEALQKTIKEKLGYIGKREMKEMDVMVLSVRNANDRLKRNSSQSGSSTGKPGEFSIVAQPISTLAGHLESQLRIPVIDRTGLTGNFDIEMRWDPSVADPNRTPDSDRIRNLEEIKKAVADQLGLQLIPSRERIEVLVVERARN